MPQSRSLFFDCELPTWCILCSRNFLRSRAHRDARRMRANARGLHSLSPHLGFHFCVNSTRLRFAHCLQLLCARALYADAALTRLPTLQPIGRRPMCRSSHFSLASQHIFKRRVKRTLPSPPAPAPAAAPLLRARVCNRTQAAVARSTSRTFSSASRAFRSARRRPSRSASCGAHGARGTRTISR